MLWLLFCAEFASFGILLKSGGRAVPKSENLVIRVSPEVKGILEAKAAVLGMNMSEYVRLLILEDARKVLNAPKENTPSE